MTASIRRSISEVKLSFPAMHPWWDKFIAAIEDMPRGTPGLMPPLRLSVEFAGIKTEFQLMEAEQHYRDWSEGEIKSSWRELL